MYLYQNSFQETQSDLEVILEFLEEYYRQNTGENGSGEFSFFWSLDTVIAPVASSLRETIPREQIRDLPFTVKNNGAVHALASPLNELTALVWHSSCDIPYILYQIPAKSSLCTRFSVLSMAAGRKVRLFHFLFEMLEDPNMAHCVSWVPAAAGVFRFSSRNKDQVAALWGQRKGNKRPMTYQKMSRALRNYARSGEIFKVKKKLTYQFSRDTLMSLQSSRSLL
uniref:Transcription factor Spi-C n=1 Tax=Lates calcarifer TaxID=8187 RepID=A0A4W6FFT5_LATCA